MNKIYIIPCILAIGVVFLLFSYFFINRTEDINIACHGTLITGSAQMASRVRVSVFLQGRNGRTNFDGITTNSNNETVIIRRASSFTFSRYWNAYTINNSIVSELPGNVATAESLRSMFPSFMLFDDEDYRFNLYRVGNSGYLFMSDKFVTLYCTS